MVLAWKKPHWLAASTWAVSTSVCALLAPVSETARKAARMAIRMAIFLFSPLIWPASDIFSAPPTFDLDQVDTGSSAVPLRFQLDRTFDEADKIGALLRRPDVARDIEEE